MGVREIMNTNDIEGCQSKKFVNEDKPSRDNQKTSDLN